MYLTYFSVKNTGKKPILPKEFFENITVSVNKNWKIIGVSNESSYPKGIKLVWHKLNDREYSVQPALINPNDEFTIAVYTVGTLQSESEEAKTSIEWNGRIENLSKILIRESESLNFKLSGIVVLISGWALPFTMISFVILLGAILFLSKKSEVLPGLTGIKIAIIVTFSTLAISSSEVLAYYIFQPIDGGEGANWINWSILVLQSAILIFLSIKVMNRK